MRVHFFFLTIVLSLPTLAIAVTPADDKPASASQPPEGTPPPKPTPEGAKHQPRGWNDKRRTVRSYPGNLAYNALRVFSVPNLPPLLVGAGLTGASTAFDTRVVDYFNRHPQEKFGNLGADVGGTAAVAGLAIGLFSAGRIAPGDRFRSFSYDASQSMVIATAYTIAIKGATGRWRPDRSNRQSFPSGHAALAFSWASVAGSYYGPVAGIPAYSVASLIAVSRLAHHSHYLSDIVAGATMGFTVGHTVVRGNTRAAAGPPASPVVPDLPKPKVELMPDFGPQGDGAGAKVMVSF